MGCEYDSYLFSMAVTVHYMRKYSRWLPNECYYMHSNTLVKLSLYKQTCSYDGSNRIETDMVFISPFESMVGEHFNSNIKRLSSYIGSIKSLRLSKGLYILKLFIL